MAKKSGSPFSCTLYRIYHRSGDTRLNRHQFLFHSRKHGAQPRDVLIPVREADGNLQRALDQLQPLARKLFAAPADDTTPFTELNEELKRKLVNKEWQCEAPAWAKKKIRRLLVPEQSADDSGRNLHSFSFTFKDAGGIWFEKSTCFFYLVIEPRLPKEISPEETATFARMMVNTLYKRIGDRAKLKRVFPGREQLREGGETSEQKFLRKQFQGNTLPLIDGLMGGIITMEDIFNSMAGPDMQGDKIGGDRFLCQSLLITPEDKDSEAPGFSTSEYRDLTRLALGESDRYFPAVDGRQPNFVQPVLTFRNVLFIAAGEGLAGCVKPGSDQEFLRNDFRNRYENIYRLLFVLAAYQRHRLTCLAGRLERIIAAQDRRAAGKSGKEALTELRTLRMETARHALRIMNTQPAFLTNHRELYAGLQRVFGIRALAAKVQQSTTELDYLLGDQYRRRREKENRKFDMAKVILAMVAEAVALPYYLYSLLSHIREHVDRLALNITLFVTVGVIAITWRKMPEHYRKWSWLTRLRLILEKVCKRWVRPGV